MANKKSTKNEWAPAPGLVRLKAPAGLKNCGVDGTEFEIPEDGLIDVPVEFAADLTIKLGFTDPE